MGKCGMSELEFKPSTQGETEDEREEETTQSGPAWLKHTTAAQRMAAEFESEVENDFH